MDVLWPIPTKSRNNFGSWEFSHWAIGFLIYRIIVVAFAVCTVFVMFHHWNLFRPKTESSRTSGLPLFVYRWCNHSHTVCKLPPFLLASKRPQMMLCPLLLGAGHRCDLSSILLSLYISPLYSLDCLLALKYRFKLDFETRSLKSERSNYQALVGAKCTLAPIADHFPIVNVRLFVGSKRRRANWNNTKGMPTRTSKLLGSLTCTALHHKIRITDWDGLRERSDHVWREESFAWFLPATWSLKLRLTYHL
jgi:hypothetical protein